MNLSETFRNDLPLSPKKLIYWLNLILNKVDHCEVDYTTMETVKSRNKASDITSLISIDKFDEIHDAITNGNQVEIVGNNHRINLLSAMTDDVVSDEFYSFELSFIDCQSQHVILCIAKLSNAIYLDNKKIVALTS